ncbi:MAG: MOSC domain-containing protein [Chloroflexia bacterium]
MSVDLEKAAQAGGVLKVGKVLAVCYSEELIDGVGKHPHVSGEVTKLGIPGDRHYGETRNSSRLGIIPNDRPITIVGIEAAVEVCERLGIPLIPPGGLGENVLIEGMGDLGDIEPGDRVRFLGAEGSEPSVVLVVTLQNEPCANLKIYHKLMTKELYGRRGVICLVEKEGTVQAGDRVELLRGE